MKLRWGLMWLIFFSTMINYFDRVNISIVAPILGKQYHIGPAVMGVILSMWALGFLIFAIPTSRLGDIKGPKPVFGGAAAAWSLANGLLGVATGAFGFGALRFFVGAAESPAFPLATKVAGTWFPSRLRATAIGLNGMGLGLGLVLGAPVAVLLLHLFGWRGVFFGTGLLGLVWALVWKIFGSNGPATDKRLSEAERRSLEEDLGRDIAQTEKGTVLSLGYLLSQTRTWAVIIGMFGAVYISYFYVTWLPTYLVTTRHMSVIHAGLYTMIPNLGAAIGAILGGYICDIIVRKTGNNPFWSRRFLFAMLLVLSGLAVFPAAGNGSPLFIVTFIGLINLFLQWGLVVTHTISVQVAGPSTAASFDSFLQFVFGLSAFLSPLVAGFIVQATGGFYPALMVAAIVGIVSALLFFVMYRENAQKSIPTMSSIATETPH
ncbi:MAG: MFS transporter [Firmicutes bacterium]|nr:MFS transporter [Bacillota bacterium]